MDAYGQTSFLMCSWINVRLRLHMFPSLRRNKKGRSTRYAMFPRYACVHVLEEMKSLQCSRHSLAEMQISSTLIIRERGRRNGRAGDRSYTIRAPCVELTQPVSQFDPKGKQNTSLRTNHIFHKLEKLLIVSNNKGTSARHQTFFS